MFCLKLIANSITYPLSVVSTVSSISGAALVAAKPPKMALYASWIDVFKHLYENVSFKQNKRKAIRNHETETLICVMNTTLTKNREHITQHSFLDDYFRKNCRIQAKKRII